MSTIPVPTAEDLLRDLTADYHLAAEAWWDLDTVLAAKRGWPAAIRRALFAEAERDALRTQVAGHCARIAAQPEELSRPAGRSDP